MLSGDKVEKKKQLAHLMSECVITCNYCFGACLNEEDVKMMKECIRLDKECAEICMFSISMLHKSRWVSQYLQLCAEICDACALECGKFPHDHCKKCAETCKKCAEACRDFMHLFQS